MFGTSYGKLLSYDRQRLAAPTDSVLFDRNLARAILIRLKTSYGEVKVCLLP